MTFTLIPSGPHSVAATRDRPQIHSLAAAYICKRIGNDIRDLHLRIIPANGTIIGGILNR